MTRIDKGGVQRQSTLALAVVGLGLFMAFLDASIVWISLPAMMQSFKADVATISWVVNAYNLVYATVLVTGGKIADQFGRRRTYAIGVIFFGVFSIACALAPSAAWLIGFRALQGLAAAFMVPATLALVMVAYPTEKLGAGLGAWGAIGAFAAAVGPPLGGAITEWASWRWIFWVNVPVAIVAVALSRLVLVESSDPNAGQRVDLLGVLTLSCGLFMLTLALLQGGSWGWASLPIAALVAGAAIAIVAWVVIELNVPAPMVDLSVFHNVTFSAGSMVLLLTSVGMTGGLFLMPQFLVHVTGLTALAAGIAIAPTCIAVMVVAVPAGRLSDRIGPRVPVAFGLVLMAVGLAWMSWLKAGDGVKEVLGPVSLLGAGIGLALVPANTAAIASVPGQGVGVASGILTMFRQLGIVAGVTLLVAVLNVQLANQVAPARHQMRDIVQQSNLPSAATAALVERVSDFSFDLTLTGSVSNALPATSGNPKLLALRSRLSVVSRRLATDAFDRSYLFVAAAMLLGLIPALLQRGSQGRSQRSS